jgi:hypothetical protein
MDWDRDCNKALTFIKTHALRGKIIHMYTNGPPKDKGFMWWKNESEEYKAMEDFVLANGLRLYRVRIHATKDPSGHSRYGEPLRPKE